MLCLLDRLLLTVEALASPSQDATARRICAACPVWLACARYGLELLETTGQVLGMYGGLTRADLREVARWLGRPARKVAQHGTRARYVAGCRCPDCTRANARGEHSRRLDQPA